MSFNKKQSNKHARPGPQEARANSGGRAELTEAKTKLQEVLPFWQQLSHSARKELLTVQMIEACPSWTGVSLGDALIGSPGGSNLSTAQVNDWKLKLQELWAMSGHTKLSGGSSGTAQYVWKDGNCELPFSQSSALMNHVQEMVIEKENQVKNPDLCGILPMRSSASEESYVPRLAESLDDMRSLVRVHMASRAHTQSNKQGEDWVRSFDSQHQLSRPLYLGLIMAVPVELAKQSSSLYITLVGWLGRVAPMRDAGALAQLPAGDLAQISRFLCVRLSMLATSTREIGIILDNVPEPERTHEIAAVLPSGTALGLCEGWMNALGPPMLDQFGILKESRPSAPPNASPFLDWVFPGQATVPCLELRAACREEVLGQSLTLQDAYNMLVEVMKEQRTWEGLAEGIDSQPWLEDFRRMGGVEQALDAKVRAAYGIPPDSPPLFAWDAACTEHGSEALEQLLHDIRKDTSVARLWHACNSVDESFSFEEQTIQNGKIVFLERIERLGLSEKDIVDQLHELGAAKARLEMIKAEMSSSTEIISMMIGWQRNLHRILEELTSYRLVGVFSTIEHVMEIGGLDKARQSAQVAALGSSTYGSGRFPGFRKMADILQGLREARLRLGGQQLLDWVESELPIRQADYHQRVRQRLCMGSSTLHMLWQQLAHVACLDRASTIAEHLLRPIIAGHLVSGAAAWRERMLEELMADEVQEKGKKAAGKGKLNKSAANQSGSGEGGKAKVGGSKGNAASGAAGGAASASSGTSTEAASTEDAETACDATTSASAASSSTQTAPAGLESAGADGRASADGGGASSAAATGADCIAGDEQQAGAASAAAAAPVTAAAAAVSATGGGASVQDVAVPVPGVGLNAPVAAPTTVPASRRQSGSSRAIPGAATPGEVAAREAEQAPPSAANTASASRRKSKGSRAGGTAAQQPASNRRQGAASPLEPTAPPNPTAAPSRGTALSQAAPPAASAATAAAEPTPAPSRGGSRVDSSAPMAHSGEAAAPNAITATTITSEGVRTAPLSSSRSTMASSSMAAPRGDVSATPSPAAPSTPAAAAAAGTTGLPAAVHSSMRPDVTTAQPPSSSQPTQPPIPGHRQMAPPPSGPLSLLLALRDGTNAARARNSGPPATEGQAPGGGEGSSAAVTEPRGHHSMEEQMAQPGSSMGCAPGGNELREDEEDEESEDLYCPITLKIMQDPVFAMDTHTYERSAIEEWLRTHNTSPLTGAPLPSTVLMPNTTLRKVIQGYLAKQARRNKPVQV